MAPRDVAGVPPERSFPGGMRSKPHLVWSYTKTAASGSSEKFRSIARLWAGAWKGPGWGDGRRILSCLQVSM